MPYLNCPECRLTVYASPYALREECPRCQAKLGKVSRLFRSELPHRLTERLEGSSRGERPAGPTPAG